MLFDEVMSAVEFEADGSAVLDVPEDFALNGKSRFEEPSVREKVLYERIDKRFEHNGLPEMNFSVIYSRKEKKKRTGRKKSYFPRREG